MLESKGRKNATHCYIKYMLVLCYLTKLSIMNQNLHLTAFEARMSKIKVLAEAISDEGCCLCLTQHLCAWYLHMVQGTKEANLYHCHFIRKCSTFKDGVLLKMSSQVLILNTNFGSNRHIQTKAETWSFCSVHPMNWRPSTIGCIWLYPAY